MIAWPQSVAFLPLNTTFSWSLQRSMKMEIRICCKMKTRVSISRWIRSREHNWIILIVSGRRESILDRRRTWISCRRDRRGTQFRLAWPTWGCRWVFRVRCIRYEWTDMRVLWDLHVSCHVRTEVQEKRRKYSRYFFGGICMAVCHQNFPSRTWFNCLFFSGHLHLNPQRGEKCQSHHRLQLKLLRLHQFLQLESRHQRELKSIPSCPQCRFFLKQKPSFTFGTQTFRSFGTKVSSKLSYSNRPTPTMSIGYRLRTTKVFFWRTESTLVWIRGSLPKCFPWLGIILAMIIHKAVGCSASIAKMTLEMLCKPSLNAYGNPFIKHPGVK